MLPLLFAISIFSMDTITIVGFIITFLSGGILGILYEVYKNKGSITLNEAKIILYYRETKFDDYVVKFNLDMLFINTSGHQRIIKDLEVKFYNGKDFIPLRFENHNTRPADIIEPRKTRCLQYVLLPYQSDIAVPIMDVAENIAHLEVSYNIKNKKRKLFLHSKDWTLKQVGVFRDANY